jgi:dolichol-phosphate mannosyltransferase
MAFGRDDFQRLKPRIIRFVKFGLVGGTGVAVNAGILALFTEGARIDYRLSSVCAIEFAIVNNFIWNYRWTWKERRGGGRMLNKFVKFHVSSGLTALAVNWGILVVLTEVWGIHYAVSNLIGIAIGTVSNFLFTHFWAFRGHTVQEDHEISA